MVIAHKTEPWERWPQFSKDQENLFRRAWPAGVEFPDVQALINAAGKRQLNTREAAGKWAKRLGIKRPADWNSRNSAKGAKARWEKAQSKPAPPVDRRRCVSLGALCRIGHLLGLKESAALDPELVTRAQRKEDATHPGYRLEQYQRHGDPA